MTAAPGPATASLPMYDWPERVPETDAFWIALGGKLMESGIEAPGTLERKASSDRLWRDPDLVFSQTCGWPLVTRYHGTLHVIARPSYAVEGCGAGTYRSAIVARHKETLSELVRGTIAVNGFDSLSGYRTLAHHLASQGIRRRDVGGFIETGSHRESIRAVAAGRAHVAAIDCVSWQLTLDHEPAARKLIVIDWTEELPALPFVTSKANAARADTIRDALEAAVKLAPQPHLAGVREASLGDYAAVTALGERARAAGF